MPPANERRYVPNELIIEVDGSPSDQFAAALAARYRLNRMGSQRIDLTGSTWYRWQITGRRNVPAVIRTLEADASIRSVQPNYIYTIQEDQPAAATVGVAPDQRIGPSPNAAPAAGNPAQYALAKLRLPEAQTMARGGNVVVAVIDTQIDLTHPELAGSIVDSFDALGQPAPMDQHGTGIAGTIASHAKLLGAAPDVRILAIRAIATGRGGSLAVMSGIQYAIDHGAKVINMSFAGPRDPGVARLVAAARSQGSILIAASGNQGPKSAPLFPAADPNVIAVTATDANDRLFGMANRGDYVAVAAPGVDILVPAPKNTYIMSSGTSFSSAFVSGIAALLVQRKPDLTQENARDIFTASSRPLVSGPRDDQSGAGAGLLDAGRAVQSLGAAVPVAQGN